MKKVILWDNDGVLVDTEKYYFQANKEILSKIGIELTEDVFADLSLKKGTSVFNLAYDYSYTQNEVKELIQERNKLYSELITEHNCKIAGAEKVLSALYGKIKMGVVTSSRSIHFEQIHNKTDLIKYFDFILTREDYINSKPSPEPYSKALLKADCIADEAVVFEDTIRGLTSALAAGIDCYIIPNRFLMDEKFEGSQKILQSIDEVLELDFLRVSA